jgi:hypothetical protein
LAKFASSLMAALHAQGNTADASTTDPAASSSVWAAHAGGHGHGHGGHIGADLQGLIQSLSDSSDSSSTAGTSPTTISSSTGSTVASAGSALQASYSNLVSALGGSSGSGSLTSFLQTFSTDLANLPAGHLINTTA